MKTPTRRTLLIGAVAALAAGGAVGGALAASGTFDPKAERQAFLNDAAGRLGVTSSKLEDAVKAGRLTGEQRNQMLADFKAHIDDLVNGTPSTRPAGAFHDGFRFAPGGFHAPFPAEAPGTLQPTA